MAMSMGNMYNFQSLTSPLAYSVSQPPIVPSTSTVADTTLPTSNETLTSPPSGNVPDNFCELYTSENNNDGETCSSARSNASPRSQDEQAFLGSFNSDRYVDMGEQEKIKLERKRARNREAASKCRQRKIQKIDSLKKEVAAQESIKASNEQKLEELESIVKKLRHIVQEHQTQGCQMVAK